MVTVAASHCCGPSRIRARRNGCAISCCKRSLASASEHRILTDIDVAERLGVSRFTVRSWRLKGVGPRFLKMGRAVRYRSEDVDEYERQALVETQPPSDQASM